MRQSQSAVDPAAGKSAVRRPGDQQPAGNQLLAAFGPLILDAGFPLGLYYALSSGAGMSDVAALGWSSVVPALRTVWGLVRGRSVNGLALLILAVNAVGLALSTVAGDPRLMMAKDSGVSSVVGIAVLLSLRTRRPLMTAGLKPWVTKGSPAGEAAWDRLLATSEPFRRAERRFSLIWGCALLAECVIRVVGAYTLPVHVMVWLGTVLAIVAVLFAMVVAGAAGAHPLEQMVGAEVARDEAVRRAEAAGTRVAEPVAAAD
ncbi:VC0807 family protein [Streptomyces sp. YGL11-2]|uniref:VC0807 family protein n=1 Tax=Streptomyces sp. YGL11-2 TaxID=3414028 RepID=UPI003CF33E4A